MSKRNSLIETNQFKNFKIPNYLAEKKLAVQEAITGEMVVEALDEIRVIARNPQEPALVRLAAWNSWLDRVVGKPTKEIHKESTEMKFTATADLTNLSNYSKEQLEAIERILCDTRLVEGQGGACETFPQEILD